jgi:high-affinity nickel-transport protein
VGAAIIVFKIAIPTRLGLAMEFCVATVLILLGVGATASVVRRIGLRVIGNFPNAAGAMTVDSHFCSHDEALRHQYSHVHPRPDEHVSRNSVGNQPPEQDHRLPVENKLSFAARRPLLRSFGVGLVHGLAGSAAIALLVLSAIPQPLWATLYLTIFCLGTIVGMGLITTAIITPFLVAARRMSWVHQSLVTGSGLLSFGFGLFLAYQLGVVDHLFGAVPIWTPH